MNGERAKILLVDDRPDKILALKTVLASLQQEIVAVDSGAQALRLLLQQDFAVILLDVNMPVMSGFETAARIRERSRLQHVPIIFITARDTSEAELLKAYSLGAVDYLPLPLAPEIILAKVSSFVELHKKTLELQRARDELKETNDALETFSYTVAHDLRAPLRAMRGFSQALEDEYSGRLDDQARQYLHFISGSALKMDTLITDLLDYSRLASTEIVLRKTNLNEVVAEATAVLGPEINARKAVLTVQPNLPEAMGHKEALRQVVSNLISNALKYVRSELTPRIDISSEVRDGRVRLWVADNGIGIAPEHRERIFRIFERLHGDAFPGTGVGLAIVQKCIERMRGKAGVDSQPGEGSRFWIELPRS